MTDENKPSALGRPPALRPSSNGMCSHNSCMNIFSFFVILMMSPLILLLFSVCMKALWDFWTTGNIGLK